MIREEILTRHLYLNVLENVISHLITVSLEKQIDKDGNLLLQGNLFFNRTVHPSVKIVQFKMSK